MKNYILFIYPIVICFAAIIVNNIWFMPRIGYIDTSIFLSKNNDYQKVKESYNQKRQLLGRQLDTLDVEFQNIILRYNKALASNRKDSTEVIRKLLEARRNQIGKFEVESKKRLEEMERKDLTEAVKKINNDIKAYGQNHGYKVILGSVNGSVVYGSNSYDLTNDILEYIQK